MRSPTIGNHLARSRCKTEINQLANAILEESERNTALEETSIVRYFFWRTSSITKDEIGYNHLLLAHELLNAVKFLVTEQMKVVYVITAITYFTVSRCWESTWNPKSSPGGASC